MIRRQLAQECTFLAQTFPALALLGPRQSGKTTLSRANFPHHIYFSMENLDTRSKALADPRKFFADHENEHGIIIDEVQEAPELLSYMQGIIDATYRPGYFIVTGSANITLLEKVTQTLAGRIGLLTLLPLTVDELKSTQTISSTLHELLVQGFYPRIYAQATPYQQWLASYINTYIERDVRQIVNITSLSTFQNFLILCAARVGQLLNYSDLAKSCGISVNTARAWISLLETCYIVRLLQPYYKNFNKRIIKSPKLYFCDTGLVSSLLGINTVEALEASEMRGQLFENFVIIECLKYFYNSGKQPRMYFWRDSQGHEIDCLFDVAGKTIPLEVKSSTIMSPRHFDTIKNWETITDQKDIPSYVVYGGNQSFGNLVAWNEIKKIIDELS